MHRLVVAIIALVVGAGSAFAQGTDDLARRAIERRGVEAMIWAMPAVNADLMLQEMLAKTRAQAERDRLLVAAGATGRTRR